MHANSCSALAQPLVATLAVALLGLAAPTANAANVWYWGTLSKVVALGADGSFNFVMNNSTLTSSCPSGINFNAAASEMGAERTKIAFAMAMLAFSSDREFGVVVNLPICKASPTSTQGAGIQ